MVLRLLSVVIATSVETAIALSSVIADSRGTVDSKFPSGRTMVTGLLSVAIASSVEIVIALSNVTAGSTGAVDSKFSETVSG